MRADTKATTEHLKTNVPAGKRMELTQYLQTMWKPHEQGRDC